MDAKEAIASIKILCAITTSSKNMNNARDMAIEALEKQVPKKPNKRGGIYFCPECQWIASTYKFNEETQEHIGVPTSFCPSCGQAINNDKE